MDTLDRLIATEYVQYFILLLIGLAVVFLGVDFFSSFWKLGMNSSQLFFFYLYKTPDALNKFLPVACLMAALLVLTNLSRQGEVLALYAGGISRFRIASTFIATTALICTISFLFFDTFVPLFSRKQMLLQRGQDTSNYQALTFYPSRYWYRSRRLIYNVARYVPGDKRLEEVNIFVVDPGFRIVQTIRAKQAVYVNDTWILEHGFTVDYPADTHYPTSKRFDVLTGVIPDPPSHFQEFVVSDHTLRLKDLRRYIEKSRSYGIDTTGTQLSYHERLAMVFTPIIFVLLAVPFATTPLKNQSMVSGVGYCFVVVFLYLITMRFTLTMGRSGQLPPVVAAWAANALFLAYASTRLARSH